MKTIKQHLEELPEPWRSEALSEADPNALICCRKTQQEALLEAIYWKHMPQGFKYLSDLYNSLGK